MVRRFHSSLLLFTMVVSISCHKTQNSLLPAGALSLLVMSEPKIVDQDIIFNQDVILYPGAFFETIDSVKIIFQKKVTIIGESQVFSENANVEFKMGTLSALNPFWFGARGDDEIDDTKAIQKTLDIARHYEGSINIEFPLGKYLVSQTLELGNVMPNRKSINWIGKSRSTDGLHGSSLQWVGEEGGVLLRIQNYCLGTIENMDFNIRSSARLKHNIEMRPFDFKVLFRDCSFTGCAGPGSANVNLNFDNNLQVSEVLFDNCDFRGITSDAGNWDTEAAVIGGYSNTKDFYFNFCSFAGYSIGAINLGVTDVLKVENCTFAYNTTDIVCLVCNTLATSNYSEHSGSFFRAGITNNVSFTTLMNNCFYRTNDKEYIIAQGGGHLVMINNNFGGMGGDDFVNKINWDTRPFSSIYSLGNFFKNASPLTSPFEFNEPNDSFFIQTNGDLIGRTLEDIKVVKIDKIKPQQ